MGGKYNFGSVGGNVSITEVGGDLIQVGGNMTQGAVDPAQRAEELDKLRAQLREVKTAVEASAQDEDARDALVAELLQQVRALNELKTAQPDERAKLTDCLSQTNQLLDKAKTFGEQAASIALKVAPAVTAIAALFGVAL